LWLIRSLGRLGKPFHLHLHDGHPLIPGLSDHFSFLIRVPVPFEHHGRRSLDPLYGPAGLAAIVETAARAGGGRASLTLEIHQAEGRRPLADAAGLFGHWRDLTNAERMNHWLGGPTGSPAGPPGPGGRSRPGAAGGPWPPGACGCRPGPR